MLIQYSVENYKSIKEEVILNFSASNSSAKNDWLIELDNPRYNLYKGIGLVGPNASGKTNILDSFEFAIRFIKNTISRKENAKINVEPFMLEAAYKDENSSFEFIYIVDGIKYVYGFSINSLRVEEEYLLAYYSIKPTTVFERTNCKKYEFKGNDTKTQTELSEKTNDNRLYMPVAADWKYEKLIKAYSWFANVFEQYEDISISEVVESIVEDTESKMYLLEALQKADLNIVDIYVKNRKVEKQQLDLIREFVAKLVPEIEMDNLPETRAEIYLVHQSKGTEEFAVDLDRDSSGTQMIVNNISELLFLGKKGGMILKDELGKVYHTKLTKYYLDKIKNAKSNPQNVQLLFSTHDTKVMNLLNPDQIYLVDKNEEGATIVKLLDDYTIRKTDNIELGYLKGRYGAVPYMRE